MMKILTLLILLCFGTLTTSAQGALKQALAKVRSQTTCDTLLYFGTDLSQVRVNDTPKISRSLLYSQVYPPAWITFINENLSLEGFIRNVTGFSTFINAQKEIYNKSIKVNPALITGYDKQIHSDSIDVMISGYVLQSHSGTGLVLIPESFSKPRETATTWVVFFDVRSRRVIYKTKIYGKCTHMGYTAHWASGVIYGFKKFARH
jgi:hypothetical protein